MNGAKRMATGIALAAATASGCALPSTYADAPRQHAQAVTAKAAVATSTAPASHAASGDQLALSPTRLRGVTRWPVGNRSFLLYVPRRVARPAHVLYALGGLHWSAHDTWRNMRLDASAEHAGAIVVYPEPIANEWNAIGCCDKARANDLAFLSQVRRRVAQLLEVDSQHQELLGFSVGGMLAYVAACTDPGWSSIAVVGATLTARCTPRHPFAITDISGDKDSVVPWNGGWSGYTQRQLAAVGKIDRAFATAFRCRPARKTTAKHTTWTTYAGCLGGITVRDAQVPGLAHHWTTKEKDGWDMGPTLWQLSPP
jgi:poly(3-hydroxybutyrate) depolymerase